MWLDHIREEMNEYKMTEDMAENLMSVAHEDKGWAITT